MLRSPYSMTLFTYILSMLQSVALQKSTKVVGLMKMVPPLSIVVATLPRIVSPLLLKLLNITIKSLKDMN